MSKVTDTPAATTNEVNVIGYVNIGNTSSSAFLKNAKETEVKQVEEKA